MDELAVFERALDLNHPDERAAYLDEIGRQNARLRSRVEALLRSHEQAGSFLHDAAAGPAITLDQPPLERTGTVIGPYKLLQEIGQGGMGVVYMAEQTEPVRRKVALKIIKPGMDTRQVIARFEAERQALSLMDHPNIARVLDAGTTDSGWPYFVMELVKGLPITQYCDEHHLTPRERLEMLLPICQAIQHAHQKGIIHRDIKPSNVLVAEYDEKPVPKVIDFGVAKAINQPLTEKTVFTGFGQIVGTLDYMSPEQAKVNQLDIDTRSDVYSLGVLMYELLTGTTPFDKQRLRSAAWNEMLRIIREEEPPKPSTRLSESKDSLPSVSALRQTEPARLTRLVRGELDWIVMKALEKDRTRRYATANGLANDIQRYLNDEPVAASPPSAAYRFRKFARRNKAKLFVSGVLAGALLVVVSSIGWAVRDRAAREAEIARERNERQAEMDRERAARQAEIARERDQRLARVRTQVEVILTDVDRLAQEQQWDGALAAAKRAEAALAGSEAELAITETVRTALRELEFVSMLSDIRMERAVANINDGSFHRSVQSYGQAFRDFGVDLEALSISAAIAQLKCHPRISLPIVAALDDFVILRHQSSRSGAGEAGWSSLVEIARGLDAEPLRNQLRAMWERKLTPDHHTREKTEESLQAILREGRGSDANAVRKLLRAAQVPKLTPEFQTALRESALSFDSRARGPQTTQFLVISLLTAGFDELAEQVLRKAQHDFPGDFWLSLLLGNALCDREEYVEAVRFYSVALGIKPDNPVALCKLGHALEKQGNPEEAIACYGRAIELDPTFVKAPYALACVLLNQEKLEEAIACYRKAVTRLQTAHETDPKVAYARENLAAQCDSLSLRLANGSKVSQRNPAKAVEFSKLATQVKPDDYRSWNNLGVAHYRAGDWQAAVEALEKADTLFEGHSPWLPRPVRERSAFHRMYLAMAHWQLGDKAEARKWYDEAMEIGNTMLRQEAEQLLGISGAAAPNGADSPPDTPQSAAAKK